MSPLDWAVRPVKQYAVFSGRAPRAEFWWFHLFWVLLTILTIVIDSCLGFQFEGEIFGGVTLLLWLALILPYIAVSVRRLHDTDRSGWWLLIEVVPLIGALVLLVFLVERGTPGENRFGHNPYGA